MNENQDLLDLCRLNQLRDLNDESSIPEDEKEANAKAIDWKIRQKVSKIKREV